MKAVLISIQPKYCELIASGKKTIEVRKTRPKIDTPFKCYIYCTKSTFDISLCFDLDSASVRTVADGRGKVIGEFVCDEQTEISPCTEHCGIHYPLISRPELGEIVKKACISFDYLYLYGVKKTNGCYGENSKVTTLFGWYISDLKIYDKPKELEEFGKVKPKSKWTSSDYCAHCIYHEYTHDSNGLPNGEICHSKLEEPLCDYTPSLTRPPQSWCYVIENE